MNGDEIASPPLRIVDAPLGLLHKKVRAERSGPVAGSCATTSSETPLLGAEHDLVT